MDPSIQVTIDTLLEKVRAKAQELAELKRTINFLSKEAGEEPPFPDEVPETATASVGRPDQFYGKSPIVAAREYLESRARAVPVEEILSGLERGGFDFEAQGWKKADRLRSLAISLSKNTAIFHKLPNGTYGLVKFYPNLKAKRTNDDAKPEAKPAGAQAQPAVAAETEEESEGEEPQEASA